MIQKIGVWGSIASIVALTLYLLDSNSPVYSGEPGSRMPINAEEIKGGTFNYYEKYENHKKEESSPTYILDHNGKGVIFTNDKDKAKYFVPSGTPVEIIDSNHPDGTKVKILFGELERQVGIVMGNSVRLK